MVATGHEEALVAELARRLGAEDAAVALTAAWTYASRHGAQSGLVTRSLGMAAGELVPNAVTCLREPDRLVGDERDQQHARRPRASRGPGARVQAAAARARAQAATSRCRLRACARCASGTRRGRAGRAATPPRSANGRHGLERVADVRQRLLQADGDQDDAGHHRKVEVASRSRVLSRSARGPLRRGEAALGDVRDDVEVEPPEAADSAIPSVAAVTTPRSTPTSAPTPRTTIDSPRAMITMSP